MFEFKGPGDVTSDNFEQGSSLEVFTKGVETNALETVKQGMRYAKDHNFDTVLISVPFDNSRVANVWRNA